MGREMAEFLDWPLEGEWCCICVTTGCALCCTSIDLWWPAVVTMVAPLPGSSWAGLAMSRWSTRLSEASWVAPILEADEDE